MSRRRKVEVAVGDGHDEVIRWYRERLAEPAVMPWRGTGWDPVRLGPTWQVDAGGRWLLPDASIGWDFLGWSGTSLQHAGRPWRWTLEQARWLLWWFAVDARGEWLHTDGVLQRLKGWGKDPLGAGLAYGEALGPCRVAFMDGDEPVATDCPQAWVQLAAVSLKQTKNTMRLMPSLLSDEARRRYRVQVGKETVHALGDDRLIEAVTSSPSTLEGARSTFVLKNETQHWLVNNEGHEMAAVIERNAVKVAARTLAITNAFEPSEDSVAQRDREAWESSQAGETMSAGTLYDSLEAPPDAPLVIPPNDGESPDDHEARVRATLARVVETVRGDSVWLVPDRVVGSILDPRNPPSRSRRFWFNQVVATEDALLDPGDIDLAAAPDEAITVGEPLVMFFDGSKSDDATGLVGCRLSDGHLVTLGVWQRPSGGRGESWIVNRAAVDHRVRELFAELDVVAFWADPSHAKDDDSTGFWDELIDGWHRDFSSRLAPWAVQSGPNRHSVMWDMSSAERTKQFTLAVERFVAELEDSAAAARAGGDGRQLTHDGHPAMRQHLRNARRSPNRYGVSMAKDNRESARKIDLGVCAVGARMLRRAVLNNGETARSGVVYLA